MKRWVFLAVLLASLIPFPAQALDCGVVNGGPAGFFALGASYEARVQEVIEGLNLANTSFGKRDATAQLCGWIKPNTLVCPLPTNCILNATGTDDIDLQTFTGPVSGTISVVSEVDNPYDPRQIQFALKFLF